MPGNAFIGKKEEPTRHELAKALGPSKAVWDQFLTELAVDHGVGIREWKCYSPKWGWSLRVKRKKRTIVWLSPQAGRFDVIFIYGPKAVAAVHKGKLSQKIIKALDASPKYPEGTGLRLVIRSQRSIGTLKKLAEIKLAN